MFDAVTKPNPHPGMSFRQFVALIAALMATNALAIDSMLPALGAISKAFGLTHENERQWVITSYVLGFGAAQIFYGTLADRYGRKPVLLAGLTIYVLFSLVTAFTRSFELMLAARVMQGVGAAGSRVLTVSIVRDCYEGRKMARVTSLAFIVFLGVPILAPSFGQFIMLVFPWPAIYLALALYGAAVALWVVRKLPETLHPENRRPIAPAEIIDAFKRTVGNRISLGYTLAMTMVVSGLFGFINSAQEIFTDVFKEPRFFPLIFAFIAGAIALGSLVNSRLVDRFGTRMLSHGALLCFIVLASLHAAVAWSGLETIWSFAILQAAMMFFFGLLAGNFGAMSMEPLGHIAGSAASIQGFVSTIVAALTGFVIGQSYDGSVVPLTCSFAACSLAALGFVLIAENFRLFHPRHAVDMPA